eukprot:11775191-Alexandrium_andersonii.AAC.1
MRVRVVSACGIASGVVVAAVAVVVAVQVVVIVVVSVRTHMCFSSHGPAVRVDVGGVARYFLFAVDIVVAVGAA